GALPIVSRTASATAGMVYTLVARENRAGALEPVAKKGSGGKAGIAGRKRSARTYDRDGVALEEVIWADPHERWNSMNSPALELVGAAESQRELLELLIRDGELARPHAHSAARVKPG